MQTLTPPARAITPAPAALTSSDYARAGHAHKRINVPLNLDNWARLDPAVSEALLWFHQHALDEKLSFEECSAALGVDVKQIFHILKGTFEGEWRQVLKAIVNYKDIISERNSIHRAAFVNNSIAQLVGAGLRYALANSSIVTITGESRCGKTTAAVQWAMDNNHGASVFVIAPAFGGTKRLLTDIAQRIGGNRSNSIHDMFDACLRGFNRQRILIVDEAHRLLPGDRRVNPISLEMLRDIRDRTGCALALLATRGFQDKLTKMDYMFEQLLGRIGMPITIPTEIADSDFLPIVQQYIRRPSDKVIEGCRQLANDRGRLGIMVETLKIAGRVAANAKVPCGEDHFFKALALREKMMKGILK